MSKIKRKISVVLLIIGCTLNIPESSADGIYSWHFTLTGCGDSFDYSKQFYARWCPQESNTYTSETVDSNGIISFETDSHDIWLQVHEQNSGTSYNNKYSYSWSHTVDISDYCK